MSESGVYFFNKKKSGKYPDWERRIDLNGTIVDLRDPAIHEGTAPVSLLVGVWVWMSTETACRAGDPRPGATGAWALKHAPQG